MTSLIHLYVENKGITSVRMNCDLLIVYFEKVLRIDYLACVKD
jgi:hypothetical protein